VVEIGKGPFEECDHVIPGDSQRGACGDEKDGMAGGFRTRDSDSCGREERMGDGDGEEIASQGNEGDDFRDRVHRCCAASVAEGGFYHVIQDHLW